MITKFKIFEDTRLLKVGNYVIVNIDKVFYSLEDKNNIDILNTNISKIVEIETLNSICIKYDGVKDITWWVRMSEIIEFSDNKEELQVILDSRKFNI